MADNRPYRPFAANIQVMHRTCFVQARVRGVGILLNFVAENNRSDNLGQLSPARKIRTSLTRKRHPAEVEFSRERFGRAFAVPAQPTWIQWDRWILKEKRGGPAKGAKGGLGRRSILAIFRVCREDPQFPSSIPLPQEVRRSGTGRETLPNQFDDLNFSVQPRRWCNQYDLITLEFDTANQVLIYIVLNR